MRDIADGKLRLRPEHPGDPNATVVCKPGWTEWTTQGMGRGKKRTRPESESNNSESCPE
jgi:hypothetical protein